MRVGNGQTYRCHRTTIKGNRNTVHGHFNVIKGSSNTIVGDRNTITGSRNSVRGDCNNITGNKNRVRGDRNTARGNGNVMEGAGNTHQHDNVSVIFSSAKRAHGAEISVLDGVIYQNGERVELKKPKQNRRVRVPAAEEEKHDVEADGCIVCLARAANCAFLPCGHKCICVTCARVYAQNKRRSECGCVLCKADVKEIRRIYE